MSRLIRLFPRSWRERYAEEFEALLEDMPAGPGSTMDIVVAAARARSVAVTDAVWRVLERLDPPNGRQTAAIAAIAGGGLWSLTFGIGSLVQWGRNGRDWGFVLLLLAALLVLVGQLGYGAAWRGRGKPLVWLGVGSSSLGMILLMFALVAAMGLEPFSWALASWSPPQLWESGMVLWLIGVGSFGIAGIASGRLARTTGAFMILAAIPLLAWLVGDVPGVRQVAEPTLRAVIPGMHDAITAHVSARDLGEGWFTSRFLVALPGFVLGLAWLALGVGTMRARHLQNGGSVPRDARVA